MPKGPEPRSEAPPLTLADIEKLETELACRLPPDVRQRYLESDGFRSADHSCFLYPYLADEVNGVVRANRLLKAEEWFPPGLMRVAILGDDGVGGLICWEPDLGRAFLWNPSDGLWFQAVAPTVTQLWVHIEEQMRLAIAGELSSAPSFLRNPADDSWMESAASTAQELWGDIDAWQRRIARRP